jgi:hypothetical protein
LRKRVLKERPDKLFKEDSASEMAYKKRPKPAKNFHNSMGGCMEKILAYAFDKSK